MIEKYILEHIEKYPEMEIADVVKLIYQSEFGGGHMIKNPKASLERLTRECQEADVDALQEYPLCWEKIGNHMGRLFLKGIERHLELGTVNRFFVNTAQKVTSSVPAFEEKLSELQRMCREGTVPFDCEQLDEWLRVYRERGYPLFGHSESFRRHYHPSYRVVSGDYLEYIELFSVIDRSFKAEEQLIIAIDGRCGSGKSWLARLLSGVYPCSVVHMDDFFLRPEQRKEERLKEIGGNVDRERFLEEVARPLMNGRKSFEYQRYDCVRQKLTDSVKIQRKKLLVVEGTYSCHPLFSHLYDLKIFLNIESGAQRERILKRNGDYMLRRFISEWIPKEEEYFQTFGIREACDIIFEETT